jgi:hypothetical protein
VMSSNLRHAQARHLDEELAHYSSHFLQLLRVPIALQRLLYPLVDSGSVGSTEIDPVTSLQESPDLRGTEYLRNWVSI